MMCEVQNDNLWIYINVQVQNVLVLVHTVLKLYTCSLCVYYVLQLTSVLVVYTYMYIYTYM